MKSCKIGSRGWKGATGNSKVGAEDLKRRLNPSRAIRTNSERKYGISKSTTSSVKTHFEY